MGDMYAQVVAGLIIDLSWRWDLKLISHELLSWWKPAEIKIKKDSAPYQSSTFLSQFYFKCFALGQQYSPPLTYFVINRLWPLLATEDDFEAVT